MRTRKRMLSLLLAVCLMAGMLPAAVYAGEVRDSGADTGGLCEHHTIHGVFGTLFDYFNGLAAPVSVGEGFIDANGLKYMITSATEVTLIQNSEVYQALTKITIPETVTNTNTTYTVTAIGGSAFYGCSSLESVDIPDSVTSIGHSAFEGCSNLTSVTIPDTVTAIGNSAFYDCSNLTSVTIPKNVTSIGHSAFWGCSSLSSVTIPDSVTSIGSGAFLGCSSLSSVTIPDSVTSIGAYAFQDCGNLTEINVAEANESYSAVEGVLFNKDKTTLIAYPMGKKGSVYDIPNGVTSIGDDAFSGCSNLSSVTIPDTVTSIGDDAFSGCSNLSSVTIPDTVTSIGNFAFYGCSGLDSITIPKNVTSIGEGAFSYCHGLERVTIPDGVTSIGDSVFSGCGGLSSVIIPDGVTSIGTSAFYGCSGLSSVAIPDSVTHIGKYAFSECHGLTSVTIPSGVTIGEGAFSNCHVLTSVTFSDKVPETPPDNLPQFYTLTVAGGSITGHTDNTRYFEGGRISITADNPPDGQAFDEWKSSAGGTFEAASSPTTTFTMPADNVTVEAVFHTHSYGSSWSSGDTDHWKECTDENCPDKSGSIIENAAHTGGTATCTDKAKCETCGQSYGSVNSSNHTGGTEIRNASAATATEDGYTGDTHCKGCGVKLKTGTTIPATGSGTDTPAPDAGGDSGTITITPDVRVPEKGWHEGEDGAKYWYEDGVRQGTEGRGKEIYDPATDAWYWLDAAEGGKIATDKDVYQESDGGKWVRYDENGRMVKGEDYRYEGWYYFDPVTGAMAKGPAILPDGRKVFYDTVTGQMLKGEHNIGGWTYVFDENDGHLISGSESLFWVEIDGKWYWYEDWQRQGWEPGNEAYRGKEIYDPSSDAWYWLDNIQQGAMAKGKDVYQESYAGIWGDIEGEDGQRYGKWVRYDENGRMIKGWHTNENGTYYFELITGTMAKGWTEIDGNTYYFDETTGILR